MHDTQSTDARASIAEVVAVAARRGLDFVALSDHNTSAQLDFFAVEQPRAGGVLLVPSVEFTTYAGHANAFGATRFVPLHFGLDGWKVRKNEAGLAERGVAGGAAEAAVAQVITSRSACERHRSRCAGTIEAQACMGDETRRC